MPEPQSDASAGTGIRVIPPLVLLAALVIAFLADWLWPLGFGLPALIRWPFGLVLALGPVAMLPSLFTAFRRAGSEYDVRKVPKALVTEGAFRYSRNPGYLGSVIFGVGIGILFNTAWVLLLMVPFAVIIHLAVVLKEERVLEREFGQAYLDYKRRVGRWI